MAQVSGQLYMAKGLLRDIEERDRVEEERRIDEELAKEETKRKEAEAEEKEEEMVKKEKEAMAKIEEERARARKDEEELEQTRVAEEREREQEREEMEREIWTLKAAMSKVMVVLCVFCLGICCVVARGRRHTRGAERRGNARREPQGGPAQADQCAADRSRERETICTGSWRCSKKRPCVGASRTRGKRVRGRGTREA